MALSIIISHQLWVGDVVGAEGDHIAFGTDPVVICQCASCLHSIS